MKNLFIIGILLTCMGSYTSYCQETEAIKSVSEAIKLTDAKKLATWFGKTLDLEVSGVSGTYSNVQAEEIMRDFFKKTPLKSFTVNHEGSSNDGSEFIIGTYISTTRSYRVYALMKKEAGRLQIRQLQFEEE
jgi:hypothetical protein